MQYILNFRKKLPEIIFPYPLNKTQNTNKAVILLYHNIGLPSFKEKHKGMFVFLFMFKFQMWYLKTAGYKVVPLDSIYNFSRDEMSNKKNEKLVALTFDDGYEDFYRKAFPVLKSYGFPATVFLISEHIDNINNWAENKSAPKKLLNWSQITEMKNYGIGFGSHTKNHNPLTSLAKDNIFKELYESKIALEKKIGEIHFFAYPYGAHNEVTYNEVIRAGYKCACTSDRGAVNKGDDQFKLKRLSINFNNFPLYFIRKINSAFRGS